MSEKKKLMVNKVNIKDYHFSDDLSLIYSTCTSELFTKEKKFLCWVYGGKIVLVMFALPIFCKNTHNIASMFWFNHIFVLSNENGD